MSPTPASTLEPLPPLDRIVPEHIAYVRSALARFAVTPTAFREDLAQEVLIEAHRSRHSQLDVRALLFGITRRMVWRWMAWEKTERVALDLLPRSEPVTDRDAEDESHDAILRWAVWTAIDAMPALFREVFILTEIEDRSMPEIAAILGIPLKTGYTRLHLARGYFLESLQRVLARCRMKGRDLL